VPWDVDAPGVVAEVPAQLAEHGREGEAEERHPALRVVPVDRLQQPERGDLVQLVARLVALAVTPGQPGGQRQAQLDSQVAQRLAPPVGGGEYRAGGEHRLDSG